MFATKFAKMNINYQSFARIWPNFAGILCMKSEERLQKVKMTIFLQQVASIQPRTSPPKFGGGGGGGYRIVFKEEKTQPY